MCVTSHPLDIPGADAGDTTADAIGIRGYLDTIAYRPDASTPYTAGATVSVTLVRGDGFTDEPVLTDVGLDSEFVLRPRAVVHDASGTPIAGFADLIALALSRLTFTVTNGGDGKTGKFLIFYQRE